jgi:hypothetical protein
MFPREALPPDINPFPPGSPEWLHEIKHDGYRILAHHDGARVRRERARGFQLLRRRKRDDPAREVGMPRHDKCRTSRESWGDGPRPASAFSEKSRPIMLNLSLSVDDPGRVKTLAR